MCLCRVCSCSSITTVVPKLGKKTSNKEKTSAEPWVTFLGPGFPLPRTYLCWAAPGAELPHNTSVPEWVRLCPCNSTEQQCSQRPALHQTHKVSVLPIKANVTPLLLPYDYKISFSLLSASFPRSAPASLSSFH